MSLLTLDRADFYLLAQEILDYRDRAKIPARLGKLIASADPTEHLFHVEPSALDGPDWCNLWRITDWRTHVEHMKHKKELSHRERAVDVHITDIRNKLVRRLRLRDEFTELPEEVIVGMAEKMLLGRSADAIRFFTKLGIGDLIEADKALATFKKERNLK